MNQQNGTRRIIFFPFDMHSHYLKCLILAEAIQNDFDIYFTSSERYDALVTKQGYKTIRSECASAQSGRS